MRRSGALRHRGKWGGGAVAPSPRRCGGSPSLTRGSASPLRSSGPMGASRRGAVVFGSLPPCVVRAACCALRGQSFGPLARGPPAGPIRRRSRLCVRGCGVVRPPPSRFAPALPPPLARRSAPVSVARPAGGWSLRWGAVGVPRPVAAAGRGFSPRSLFVPPAPRLRSRFRSTEARISLRAVSWRFPSRWWLSALWWPFWASAALLVR